MCRSCDSLKAHRNVVGLFSRHRRRLQHLRKLCRERFEGRHDPSEQQRPPPPVPVSSILPPLLRCHAMVSRLLFHGRFVDETTSRSVQVWDIISGTTVSKIDEHLGEVTVMLVGAFASKLPTHVATSNAVNTMTAMHNTAHTKDDNHMSTNSTNTNVLKRGAARLPWQVTSVALSASGNQLLTASKDNSNRAFTLFLIRSSSSFEHCRIAGAPPPHVCGVIDEHASCLPDCPTNHRCAAVVLPLLCLRSISFAPAPAGLWDLRNIARPIRRYKGHQNSCKVSRGRTAIPPLPHPHTHAHTLERRYCYTRVLIPPPIRISSGPASGRTAGWWSAGRRMALSGEPLLLSFL